jgi:hypothetical protein
MLLLLSEQPKTHGTAGDHLPIYSTKGKPITKSPYSVLYLARGAYVLAGCILCFVLTCSERTSLSGSTNINKEIKGDFYRRLYIPKK